MSPLVSPETARERQEMNKERKREISADHMPPSLRCISPDSLNLSAGQSVDRCSSLEDIRLLGETPYANSERATRLRDTCSHSVKLGHVSVEPHATRLDADHSVRVDWLLARPLRGGNLYRA